MQHTIIATARSYIGTPFHHQGRLKHTGVDCLGLLICAARELSLASRTGALLAGLDEMNYSHQPDTEKLLRILSMHLYPIPVAGILPADIILLTIDGSPQHMGIVSDSGIIHAYAPARKVVEHALDEYWQKKIDHAFRLEQQ